VDDDASPAPGWGCPSAPPGQLDSDTEGEGRVNKRSLVHHGWDAGVSGPGAWGGGGGTGGGVAAAWHDGGHMAVGVPGAGFGVGGTFGAPSPAPPTPHLFVCTLCDCRSPWRDALASHSCVDY
jgi:hypothetical protein